MNSAANILKQSGLTSVEYAIIAGLISIGIAASFHALGDGAANSVNNLAQSIQKEDPDSNNSGSGNSDSGSSDSGSSDSGSSDSSNSGSGSSGSGS